MAPGAYGEWKGPYAKSVSGNPPQTAIVLAVPPSGQCRGAQPPAGGAAISLAAAGEGGPGRGAQLRAAGDLAPIFIAAGEGPKFSCTHGVPGFAPGEWPGGDHHDLVVVIIVVQ